jgi:hypothetical protein
VSVRTRIGRLEQAESLSDACANAVIVRKGETLKQAVARTGQEQGREPKHYIVVPEKGVRISKEVARGDD